MGTYSTASFTQEVTPLRMLTQNISISLSQHVSHFTYWNRTLEKDIEYLPIIQVLHECSVSTNFANQKYGTVIDNRIDLPDAIRALSFRLGNDEVTAFRAQRLLVLG